MAKTAPANNNAISPRFLGYVMAVVIQAAIVELLDNWSNGAAWTMTVILLLLILMTGGYAVPIRLSQFISLFRAGRI